jgi:MoaA/NifB/PqqE/SkfB family radical SAM enzyme
MVQTPKQVIRLPGYLWGSLEYHLAGRLYTAKPRMIQFPVCDRCNARCIMCRRWSKPASREISTAKIREVFNNPLFTKVEQVNLHGGEPTLRGDLAEICQILQDHCPKLSSIWISTNGIGSKRIETRLQEIIRILDFTRIRSLEINVSIDGIGATHDRIRGVPGGFDQARATVETVQKLAQAYPLGLTIGTVIQPLNLHELDKIESFAADLGVPVLFQPLAFDDFFNLHADSDLRFSPEDQKFLHKLVRDKLSLGRSPASFYWHDYSRICSGARRKSPCAFDRYILSLYPTGEVLPCSAKDWILFGNIYDTPVDQIWYGNRARSMRKKIKREICPTCPAYCAVEFSLQKEFVKYFLFYVRRLLSPKKN